MSRRLATALAVLALLSAPTPAAARVPPATMKPLVAPGFEPADPDEKGLWHFVEREERLLAEHSLIVDDPALKAYIADLVARLAGPHARDIRVYVVRSPEFNASMSPNGTLILFTGLLARMRNEAQLASVVAHEIGHYLRRHHISQWRDMKRKGAFMNFALLGAVGASAATGVNLGGVYQAGQAALILSLFAHSRGAEREADAYSVRLIEEAGLQPQAAGEIWGQLIEETEASARARGKRRHRPPVIFATHPSEPQRMADLTISAGEVAQPGKPYALTSPGFERTIARLRPTYLEDQIRLNDPGASLYLLNELAADGWTGTLRYYEGEVYRLRGKAGDQEHALASYRAAVALPDPPPQAHRALGYALLRTGDAPGGKAALRRYLAAAPAAPDREMVAFTVGN